MMRVDMAVDPIVTRRNKFGRYEILRELGRGELGVVYAALDQSTGAVVALKTLDPALLKGANSTWRLSHRNIVQILDAGEAEGRAYIAMELLEGESLRKMLDGPVSVARAIQIADEVACGLAYAHEKGVVHRGLKPSNILVLRSGVVKITDFGIGGLGEAAMLSGERNGCLNYMSPEQVRGEPVDPRSDIFSLGAVLYEMLTRRPAFPGGTPDEVKAKILRAEPPLPSDVNPHVPRLLDGMVLGMLAVDPDDRLPGVHILVRNLQRLEQELGLGQRVTADNDEPKPAAPQREEPTRFSSAPIDDRELRFRLDAPAAEPFQYRDTRPEREAFDRRDSMFLIDRDSAPEPPSRSRPTVLAVLALVTAVLAIGLTVVLHYSPGLIERLIAASLAQLAPATAPAHPQPSAPAPEAEAPAQPLTAPTTPQTAQQEPSDTVSAPAPMPAPVAPEASAGQRAVDDDKTPQELAADAAEPPAAAGSPAAQKRTRSTQSGLAASQQQPERMATLLIAVAPQGELYIDGKHYGTTPPIATLDLEPGVRRIEVRSGSRKPYLTYMTVQAGEVRRIQHDFDAKPSGPTTR